MALSAADADELQALPGRMALGERAALERLYRSSAARLFAVVLQIQRERAVAEEVLQEVYIRAWRAAADFDPARGEVMAWLTGIARHGAIDSLRRARARPQAAPDGQAWLETLAADAPGPAERAAAGSQARRLHGCIDQLPDPQRQSLALAYFQGLSHAEVATQLGHPLGTVKSWVRRALQSLKACLDTALG